MLAEQELSTINNQIICCRPNSQRRKRKISINVRSSLPNIFIHSPKNKRIHNQESVEASIMKTRYLQQLHTQQAILKRLRASKTNDNQFLEKSKTIGTAFQPISPRVTEASYYNPILNKQFHSPMQKRLQKPNVSGFNSKTMPKKRRSIPKFCQKKYQSKLVFPKFEVQSKQQKFQISKMAKNDLNYLKNMKEQNLDFFVLKIQKQEIQRKRVNFQKWKKFEKKNVPSVMQ